MRTLVIIPAYNEQENIVNTVHDVEKHCPKVDYVVINDCSRDDTEKILREHDMNYISLPCNLGIGGGVQTGYRYANEHGYDIAVQFDGDGQHDARFLNALIEPIASNAADIAIGSRFIRKQGFQSTGFRRFGIGFLSGLIRLLCGVNVSDVTSGMRAVNKRFIEEYSKTYAQDYPEPEAIIYAAVHGAKIVEIPVEMRERQGEKSSINPLRSVYYMIKVSIAMVLARFSS